MATAASAPAGKARHPELVGGFACTWLVAAVLAGLACRGLGGLHAYGAHTQAQVAFAIALCGLVAAWAAAEVTAWLQAQLASHAHGDSEEEREVMEMVPRNEIAKPKATVVGQSAELEDKKAGAASNEHDVEKAANGKDHSASGSSPVSGAVEKAKAAKQDVLTGGQLEALRALRACAELAIILVFVYLCDRTELFPKGSKVYNPLQFWGLWALLCIVAAFTLTKTGSEKAMPREQTDEWKGWMQVMFLMYHYFAEKEVYNAIRVYIAAYVWMTGYGNFYLYGRKDAFSLRRLLHMLFRLNFLGFCMCVLLTNEYMLYYICAMHTLFTLFVMAMLYVKRELNKSFRATYGKVVVVLLLTALLYDGPPIVFRAVFGTLPVVRPLMAFHDPVHPEFTDEMHEWHFRSGLDRFVWIAGMLFAMHIDDVQSLCEQFGSVSCSWRFARSTAVALSLGVIGLLWWNYAFRLGKYDYNVVHPYTSFVPITIYLLLRNSLPALRRRYLALFAYMGKYTLETYIFQFHIWMRTTGLNGSPKHLLVWIPGYYWLNFAVVTAVYICVSIRFFKITATLSEALVRKEPCELAMAAACLLVGSTACFLASGVFVTGF